MAGRLVSHREWEVASPFSTDAVCVDGLKLVANAGFDIWARRRAQPAEISVSLSLADSFASASATDSVDASTVHYGQLAKNIQGLDESQNRPWATPDEFNDAVAFISSETAVSSAIISTLKVETRFAKATRFGDGVSLVTYRDLEHQLNSTVLHVHNVRVPALIGVNSHERMMKQTVVVSVWIDRAKSHISECYFELEQLLVKTTDESSFATLESLAEELASRIIKYFIFPKQQPGQLGPEPAGVRVRVQKPSAIPLANAPTVEIYRSAEPQDAYGKRMVLELGNKRPVIPFPLEGRLDEFLQSWKQD